MDVGSEAIKRECVEENKGLGDQVAVLNRELELIMGLLTDRFPDLNPTLNNLLLSSMIKPVGEGAQREGVRNDEMDALCMQLYF
jgi:hypothetical protein